MASVGKVYLLDKDNEVGDKLRYFDLDDGEELWSFAYDVPGTVSFVRHMAKYCYFILTRFTELI